MSTVPTADELVELASVGIVISLAAIDAEAGKLLRRSGYLSPSPSQRQAAEKAAVEHLLLDVKKLKESKP